LKKNIALFDFDGTLTTKDTLLEFIKFYRGTATFYTGFLILSPIMVLFKAKLLANWKAKQSMLRYFLGNHDRAAFQTACDEFARTKIPALVRPEALARLREHQAKGDTVVIVSASPENWIRVFSDSLQVQLIATQLEVVNDKITGRICGRNCFGPEKAERIRAEFNLSDYDQISAYGDSRGDREMLALSNRPYYQRFS
jgi:HAD superfamily hydrolase (TIGR01490 family)